MFQIDRPLPDVIISSRKADTWRILLLMRCSTAVVQVPVKHTVAGSIPAVAAIYQHEHQTIATPSRLTSTTACLAAMTLRKQV